MKRGFVIVFSLVLLVFVLGVSSSFEKGNPLFGITEKYFQKDAIKGWINISLENESLNSLFEDSLGNSVALINLLKLNSNLNYKCNPSDCESDYTSSNPELEKTFSLNKGESKIIGFVLTGNNFESISDFGLNVSSDVGESIEPQLYIDILNDKYIEWSSHRSSNNFYNENKGCYNSPDEAVWISNNRFCEKVSIPRSPNVEIGAYVIQDTVGNVNFKIIICGEDYVKCNNGCVATASASGRISCISNEKIEKTQDYLVCINTESITDNNKYKINSETNDPCGFANLKTNERDFDIFAKAGKYEAINEFVLNNAELQNASIFIDLASNISGYLNRYNNSCTDGCVIPIKFTSNEQQTITLSELGVSYTSSGVSKEADKIYDLIEVPAKVNLGFKKMNLDKANFSVTGSFGDTMNYTLKLNNKKIFSKEITIEKIPQITSLNPEVVIAAFPTEFTVYTDISNPSINSSNKIKNYTWDFGDNKTETTLKNKITHTYSSIGNYKLKVSVKDVNSLGSSKTFNVTVKTPKEAINSVLKKKLENLNNVSSQINGFSIFKRDSLSDILDLKGIETSLSSLQKRNASANSDSDFVSIMKDLVELEVPNSVFQSQTISSTKFIPSEENINLDILKAIAGGDYSDSAKGRYRTAILAWHLDNVDLDIIFEELSAKYETSTKKISRFFKLKISANQDRRDSYFIMPKLDNLKFKQDYGEKDISDYIYIRLDKEANDIEFSTTEDILFSNLPAFISPPISELSVLDTEISEAEDKLSKQTIFILAIILAFFIGFIAYLIIQAWYKKKYEDYLFKNKNHLYNIVSYIESAKKRKIDNKEIEQKLKKAGWKLEQVKYVMRKYAGKRTGMFEIPIDKFLSRFKKNQSPVNVVEPTKHSPRKT